MGIVKAATSVGIRRRCVRLTPASLVAPRVCSFARDGKGALWI